MSGREMPPGRSPPRRSTADVADVTAFLAMAVKEKLMLNGHMARDVWEAHLRVIGIPAQQSAELLCRMLGDVED